MSHNSLMIFINGPGYFQSGPSTEMADVCGKRRKPKCEKAWPVPDQKVVMSEFVGVIPKF